jgi:hypothetical protein
MNEATDRQRVSIAFRLMGASPLATARGRHMLPGVTNYLIGNDPRQWRTGLRSFARVEYRDVYPGVDLVYLRQPASTEYDFIVAPGADYRVIGLTFSGSTNVSINAQGDLVLRHRRGQSRAARADDLSARCGHAAIGSRWVRHWARGTSRLPGRDYDPHLPLIIDPVLTYSSYLGGARDERAGGVAVDAQGRAYLAGMAWAANFPMSGPPAFTHGRENLDAFVVRLNAAGDQIEYATYLGGSDYEEALGLAIDAAGNAYVVGYHPLVRLPNPQCCADLTPRFSATASSRSWMRTVRSSIPRTLEAVATR